MMHVASEVLKARCWQRRKRSPSLVALRVEFFAMG